MGAKPHGAVVKLNLGVIDEAYTAAGGGSKTTLQVARILESKYHVMETFYELHGQSVHKALNDSVRGAVQSMLLDDAPRFDLDITKIKAAFTNYLDSGEWEKASGQYIKAAHNRHQVHHNDGSKEQNRRSNRAFIRTGQYLQAFQAWLKP